MRKQLFSFRRAKAALFLLGILVILSVSAPLFSPYSYREQLQNEETGEYLSNLPPRIPALSWTGLFSGRRTLKNIRQESLSDPERFPEGCVLSVKNIRSEGRDAVLMCDVVVDYYRYKGIGDDINFWFGTDQLGRDLWTRVWTGARLSLLIAFGAVLLDLILGISFGSICGYFGGTADLLLMRAAEVVRSIPNIVLGTLFILLLGPGILTMILALSLRSWETTARLTRAQVLRFKEQEFVIASRSMGAGPLRLIFSHILPNAAGALITRAMLALPAAMLSEAFLSYLGLGIPAPTPSLGVLLSDAQAVLGLYPYQTLFPALLIVLFSVCFQILADVLRAAFDPKETK